jgi:hypothetical protein
MNENGPKVESTEYTGVDGRRHPRFEVSINGKVRTAKSLATCRVCNISVCGALIEASVPLKIDERIVLELPGSAGVSGHVVRINGGKAGIVFETVMTAIESKLADWCRGER